MWIFHGVMCPNDADRTANSVDPDQTTPLSVQKLRTITINTYGPRQVNLVLIAYASSEGLGELAHPRSLARTSAARSYKQ